jgi:hypothetical protein
MTDDGTTLDDALRRALDAADLANDAAEDLARLGRGQAEFVDRVTAAQKRATALAGGAALGSLVALALASLVYIRSVGDLHEAAELQAETARVIAGEIADLRKTRDEEAVMAEEMTALLAALPDKVGAAIAAMEEARPEEPAAATDAVKQAVAAEVKAARDEILAAMAELDLDVTSAVGAGAGDPALAETLARIEAGLLRLSAAPANPPAAAAPRDAAPARPAAQAPRAASQRQAAPEPNPFSYP